VIQEGVTPSLILHHLLHLPQIQQENLLHRPVVLQQKLCCSLVKMVVSSSSSVQYVQVITIGNSKILVL
jgi:hypothetical protein